MQVYREKGKEGKNGEAEMRNRGLRKKSAEQRTASRNYRQKTTKEKAGTEKKKWGRNTQTISRGRDREKSGNDDADRDAADWQHRKGNG